MMATPDESAHAVLEAVPLVMRCIRSEMRSHRAPDLSVPQFRALVHLSRHRGASLSDVAGHLGLKAPSTSVMVNGLVSRGLVAREVDSSDRRRVTLALTASGQAAMEAAHEMTETRLAERLAVLPQAERAAIVQAMQALVAAFATASEPAPLAVR
jgi:DNA-binding MarR family transcriptional regulator